VLRKETPAFFQSAMFRALTELARVDGFDVAVGFDADEFWCSTVPGHTLAEQIALEMSPGLDGLSVPVVNYAQHRDVETFRLESLQTAGYSVIPQLDTTGSPLEMVDAGLPFLALPFPSKVVARLAGDVRFTEGQHSIVKSEGAVSLPCTSGAVVRHLSLPARGDLAIKRHQGLRRVDAAFSPDIGWQLQRLAPMTEAGLDEYWDNNSWHLGADGQPVLGTYDRLEEDDALTAIGHELVEDRSVFSLDRDTGDHAQGVALGPEISTRTCELLLETLVDDLGRAEVTASRLSEDMRRQVDAEVDRLGTVLVGLQEEFDERTSWALQLDAELQQKDRELADIKSSVLWRAGKALHLLPRSGSARGT
jgi:hypothetical protein